MARERDDRRDEDEEDDRPRRRPRPDDDEENEDRRPTMPIQTTNPGSTRAAGIIWVIMGSLVLLVTALNLTLGAGTGAGGAEMLCSAALPVLIGAVFLMVGIQTLNGSAKGTLGNGIGSIIFGVLIGGLGVILFYGAFFAGGGGGPGAPPAVQQLGEAAGVIIMVVAVVYLLTGAMLLVAGILAIKGKTDYLRWRKYLRDQKVHPRSRDWYQDDEEDDRPRRRRPRPDDDE